MHQVSGAAATATTVAVITTVWTAVSSWRGRQQQQQQQGHWPLSGSEKSVLMKVNRFSFAGRHKTAGAGAGPDAVEGLGGVGVAGR